MVCTLLRHPGQCDVCSRGLAKSRHIQWTRVNCSWLGLRCSAHAHPNPSLSGRCLDLDLKSRLYQAMNSCVLWRIAASMSGSCNVPTLQVNCALGITCYVSTPSYTGMLAQGAPPPALHRGLPIVCRLLRHPKRCAVCSGCPANSQHD